MNCWKDISILFYKYCLCCLGVNPEPHNPSNYGVIRDHTEDTLFNDTDKDKSATEKTIIIPQKDMVYS